MMTMMAILTVVFIWLMLLWAINKSWKNYAEIVLKQQQFLLTLEQSVEVMTDDGNKY